MLVDHFRALEVLEDTVLSLFAQHCDSRRVLHKAVQLIGKIGGISCSEGISCRPQNFGEGADVRGDYGHAARHIFGDDQAKDLARKRRNDEDIGCSKGGREVVIAETSGKANTSVDSEFDNAVLKRFFLGAIADYNQRELALSLME